MAAKKKADNFVNKAMVSHTQDVANDCTFSEIRFGVGWSQKIGIVLHRVDFFPSSGMADELVAAADMAAMAITNSDDLTDLNPTSQSVLASVKLECLGASVEALRCPIAADFTGMPSGGMLIPSAPLYFGVDTGGFAAAVTAYAVLWYTFLSLSDSDYLDLIQAILPHQL